VRQIATAKPGNCSAAEHFRTELFDNGKLRGSEFLRKVKAVARRHKLTYRWVPERGSGSHGTLYVGDRFTVVKDLKKELGPGLLSDMYKQLGIRKEDL
jgi:mRNA interferase HicA